MRYMRHGARRWFRIGRYGNDGLSLVDIHKLHIQAQSDLENGLDPVEQHAKRRKKVARNGNGPTLRSLLAEWVWHYARKERKRPTEVLKLFKTNVIDAWGDKPLSAVTRREAVLLLDKIKVRAPVVANRVNALASQVFTFCVARELIAVNPFLGIPPPGGTESAKQRWLDADEICTFWRALDKTENRITRRMALGLRLILLTGQRPGEVGGAPIAEFDLPQKVWTISAARIKTEPKGSTNDHVVPLSPTAIEIVTELTRLADGRPFLLPSSRSKKQRGRPIHEKTFSHVLSDLVTTETAKKNAESTLFGLPPFTPHDLRRTVSTHLARLGIPRKPVIDKVLNHADSSMGGVYDRYQYLKEKREALERWDTELKAIRSKQQSKE